MKKPKFEIKFKPSGFKEIVIIKYELLAKKLKNLSPFSKIVNFLPEIKHHQVLKK